jgi:hypothetical protein
MCICCTHSEVCCQNTNARFSGLAQLRDNIQEAIVRFLSSSCLEVVRQIPVVVFAEPDHDQLEGVRICHAAGQKILRSVNLELVHENATKFPAFLLPDGWVSGDLPDLLIQNLLLLFPETKRE